MRSVVTPEFWVLYRRLPRDLQLLARSKYELWRREPQHPSLRFKPIQGTSDLWSIRLTRTYRALGRRVDDECRWFWIGTHAEYDGVLRRRK